MRYMEASNSASSSALTEGCTEAGTSSQSALAALSSASSSFRKLRNSCSTCCFVCYCFNIMFLKLAAMEPDCGASCTEPSSCSTGGSGERLCSVVRLCQIVATAVQPCWGPLSGGWTSCSWQHPQKRRARWSIMQEALSLGCDTFTPMTRPWGATNRLLKTLRMSSLPQRESQDSLASMQATSSWVPCSLEVCAVQATH